jgi:protocatechuate 3,4-dioxygenase beta subunit
VVPVGWWEKPVMTLNYPIESLGAFPARLSPGYKSTIKRSPQKPLIIMRQTLSELTGPVYGHETVRDNDHDLTIQHQAEPLGERIIVHGHVQDEDGRGVPGALVELWQANACGRYIHVVDQHPAPLDPIFNSVTDEKARLRMVSDFDLDNTQPNWALCYRFNIVLRGRNATPMETK